MKKKKIIFLAVVAAAGILVAAAVILKIRSRRDIERPPTITAIQEAEGIPITVISPSRGDMPEVILLDGTVEPEKKAVLVSRINRRIEKITVDEGERIETGQTAILLDRESLQSALQAAKTALEEERRNYQRAEVLFEAGAVARQSLDQARVNRDRAESNYLQAREILEDTEITSPLSGLVSRRWMEPGEYSDSGKPILEIVDISTVEIHSPASEMLIGSIRTGQVVRVYPDAYPGRSWESEISTINPTTGEESRHFTVKTRIPNPDELLRPGMFCRVEIVTEQRPDALLLPQEAIARDDRGREGVYLVDGDNETVRFRAVETGISREGMVEIISGLDPESTVAASGNNRLADGIRVRVVGEQ